VDRHPEPGRNKFRSLRYQPVETGQKAVMGRSAAMFQKGIVAFLTNIMPNVCVSPSARLGSGKIAWFLTQR
jgi:hypothetical protein